nr:hypothetical protein [Tanacetum cinerariifolium]
MPPPFINLEEDECVEETLTDPELEVINPLSDSTTSSSPNHLLKEFADEGILIYENLFKVPIQVTPDKNVKKISISNSSLILEDFDHPLYELPFYKEVFGSETLLLFSPENKEKVFKPGILTSKGVHTSLLPELSHQGPKAFKVIKIFESPMEVDALPSTNNEDKVFNLGILIHENLFEVITRVALDKNVKKIAISHASLIIEDFDPLLFYHELPIHKEVLRFQTLLSFSSKNEEKVFKPEILTSKGVHSSLLLELSHQGPKTFKVIKILESPMEIFLALLERTSVSWMFCVSISIPHGQINSGLGQAE